jgi:hypothetical protein
MVQEMRTSVAAVAVAAAVLVPAAGAQSPQPITPIQVGGTGSAAVVTAVAEPASAAAKPVRLTLTLTAELQCGRIRAASVVVTLPNAMRMTAAIAGSAVTLNGKAPASTSVTGHVVTLKVAPPSGISCDVIGPGKIRVVFGTGAGLGNPMRAGTYAVAIRAGAASGTAHLQISA